MTDTLTSETWPNLATMLFDQADHLSDAPFLWEKQNGAYESLSWRESAQRVCNLAKGLLDMGIEPGDRIVLLSENRADWLISDVAIMAIGAITVPVYTTNTTENHIHIISDSGAKAAIVSKQRLMGDFVPAAIETGNLQFIACIESAEEQPQAANMGFEIISFSELFKRGEGCHEDIINHASRWKRDDLACIIYTSGTSGLPKGVMLSHGAILHNCTGAKEALKDISQGNEVFLSFLPISHSYEHSAGQFFPVSTGAQIYYAEGIDKLPSNMAEARPTIMTAVPRLYETMYQKITRAIQKQGGLKKRLFDETYRLGAKRFIDPTSLTITERLVDAILDRVIRNKIRQRFGGRLKALVSGGAPLNPDIGLFFTALGLRLLQGYGQTESAPVISVNRPAQVKMHTVGPLLVNTEVKIAEDGEILCRGELVMQGYWRDEEATKAVISEDGWLHTGDIGEFDDDGHLIITDRKKDIIVNSGGDNIAPQRIEGILCLQPEIAQAMVYGDKHPHLVALIVPDSGWLTDNGYTADGFDTAKALNEAVKRVNDMVSNIEKVRHHMLASEPVTIENNEMTPTMKVRRTILKARYGMALDALYN
jgi:long-chain acyl-CoA synthetase